MAMFPPMGGGAYCGWGGAVIAAPVGGGVAVLSIVVLVRGCVGTVIVAPVGGGGGLGAVMVAPVGGGTGIGWGTLIVAPVGGGGATPGTAVLYGFGARPSCDMDVSEL
jgi:hypothetical protein